MENELERHVQLPNDLIKEIELKPDDLLIYLALKSFDGPDGCYPSLASIAKVADSSIKSVKKSLLLLKNKNFINFETNGKGCKIKYTFQKYITFEPFSYRFIFDTRFTFQEKAYLAAAQQFMFKNDLNEGSITIEKYVFAKKIHMSVRSLERVESSLKQKGVLTTHKITAKDPYGCSGTIRYYNLSTYCQEIAYTIHKMSDAINKNAQKIQKVESKVDNVIDEVKLLKEALINKNIECQNLKALLKNKNKRLSIIEKENDILKEHEKENEEVKLTF